jgi:hypothetical protein
MFRRRLFAAAAAGCLLLMAAMPVSAGTGMTSKTGIYAQNTIVRYVCSKQANFFGHWQVTTSRSEGITERLLSKTQADVTISGGKACLGDIQALGDVTLGSTGTYVEFYTSAKAKISKMNPAVGQCYDAAVGTTSIFLSRCRPLGLVIPTNAVYMRFFWSVNVTANVCLPISGAEQCFSDLPVVGSYITIANT